MFNICNFASSLDWKRATHRQLVRSISERSGGLKIKKTKDRLNGYTLIRIVYGKKNNNMGFSVPLIEKQTFSCNWRTLSVMRECSASRISNSNSIPLKANYNFAIEAIRKGK